MSDRPFDDTYISRLGEEERFSRARDFVHGCGQWWLGSAPEHVQEEMGPARPLADGRRARVHRDCRGRTDAGARQRRDLSPVDH